MLSSGGAVRQQLLTRHLVPVLRALPSIGTSPIAADAHSRPLSPGNVVFFSLVVNARQTLSRNVAAGG